MSLENVTKEILQEARNKSNQIEEEKEEKIREIEEEAENKIEEIQKQNEREIEERKREIRKQKLSEARMEAKNIKLKKKQEETGKTFKKFNRDLKELIEDNKENFLETCLSKADFDVGKINGSEAFAEEIKQRGFEFKEIDNTGLVLVSEDQSRTISFTSESILKEFKNRYRKEISDQLF